MDERLYINGQQVDLSKDNTDFSRTLQCNDLASLSDRQTNFSKNLKLPKTPVNQQIMGYLGTMGNQSPLPYHKNTCDYFVGNDKIIHNGWAIVNESNPIYYDVHIYDGNIDLFKSIENKTLGDMYVGEINHTKSVSSVINTWSNDLDYCYILADYNGKSIVSGDTVNIDYLIPSVKVSYIWNRIFETYGFTYTGNIFESVDFNNLYMTYPKGVTPEDNDNILPIAIFNGGATNFNKGGSKRYILDGGTGFTSTYASMISSPSNYANGYGDTDEHIYALESRKFNIKITGKIQAVQTTNFSNQIPIDIWFVKDCVGLDPYNAMVSNRYREKIAEGITYTHNLNINHNFILDVGETFSIIGVSPDNIQHLYTSSTDFDIDFGTYDDPLYNFQNELKDFATNDFLKEIIWHFGLTMYEDKFTNNYEFRTLDEVVNNRVVVDWSSKFQSLDKEKYLYGSYAQNNIFKYKYNEENANHNDGILLVNNKNLADKKDVISSKIYSPQKDSVPFVELPSVNVYPIWNKEVKDNGQVKYKGLDKRYYFLRAVDYEFGTPCKIASEFASGATTTVTSAKTETYQGIGFDDVVQDYYSPLFSILDNAKIISAKFYLTHTDIANFDFRKLYYIEQLGGSFLINKISNYKIGKLCSVELVKLNR